MGETTRAEVEAELERLAKELGGGWGWDANVMPYLKLTLPEAQALEGRALKDVKFKSFSDELQYNLVRAEQHASQAHDMLYRGGPSRSFLFRRAIGRAHSILMRATKKELERKE